jgi:threonylcarbamoyladenosine tRNA methylthiotransferase CDKAL1
VNVNVQPGMNVFIDSYSCSRRELDAQKIVIYLKENGYTIIHDPTKADYIILMTCGVTKGIANISFKMIEKYKKYDAEVIVAGCIPDTHKTQFEKSFTGKTLSTINLDKIDELFPQVSKKFREIPESNIPWESFNDRSIKGIIRRIHKKVQTIRKVDWFLLNTIITQVMGKDFFKTFPFNWLIREKGFCYILISRGCVHNCTYCVTKKGIGRLQSKPLDQCIKEITVGLQQGFHSFVLDADDIGQYGTDISTTLPDLLYRIMEIHGSFSVKIGHSHPQWFIKYESKLADIFKYQKVTNIFASIQSGNDRILRLMGRPYSTKHLIRALQTFKKSDSTLKIGVDLIVGFPSETDEEFLDTLRLFNEIHFDYGEIYPFSCHEGTKASLIEPKISKQLINQRMKATIHFLKKNNYFVWRYNKGAIYFYSR